MDPYLAHEAGKGDSLKSLSEEAAKGDAVIRLFFIILDGLTAIHSGSHCYTLGLDFTCIWIGMR